jgi:hypothetical protein
VFFEAGSKLRRINDGGFSGCHSLKSVTLHVSVELIDGSSFRDCALSRIGFQEGNPIFHCIGEFVMNRRNTEIVRYFGIDTEVSIPD